VTRRIAALCYIRGGEPDRYRTGLNSTERTDDQRHHPNA
jgi:hypothetical protein